MQTEQFRAIERRLMYMKASNFLLHRLQVQLNMRGIEYVFSRQALDKFG